jgi:WS/DGAT/MGAT family acyltransferase
MSGVDATFLYFETPSSHMHVLGTIVVDHSDVPDWSADHVVRLIEQRLDLLPPFRRRVSSATLRLHHPFWVDLPSVDVAAHVTRVQCPAPGGMAEMAACVAEFAEKQLDRSRPLWECLVVEGMADDRAAVVFKVHHCAVDGVGAATILGSLFDLLPEGRNPAELEDARKQAKETFRPAPGLIDVTLHTAGGLALRPLKMARLVPSTAKALVGLVSHRRSVPEDTAAAVPLTAPRLPFNGAITAGRVVSYVDVDLGDVKRIKAAAGGTFNDAITGICGTAFRRYLSKRGELPDTSMIAVVPVSVRGEDDEGGNRVSAMFTTLATDVADPLERLIAVRQANQVGKGDQAALGNDLLHKVGEIAPPNTTAAIARFYSALRLADRGPVIHNVVISNVAGPPFAIHLAGAKVKGLYPLGPVLEGPGLNITVVSYVDHVGFGLIACSSSMPDLADLAEEFPLAVQELIEAIA